MARNSRNVSSIIGTVGNKGWDWLHEKFFQARSLPGSVLMYIGRRFNSVLVFFTLARSHGWCFEGVPESRMLCSLRELET